MESNPQPESSVPEKDLFRIGEVSRLTATKQFVLRYWETEFPMLQPVKSPKGHRLYRREDIETVLRIKRLLYDEGFTIAGARRHLRDQAMEASSGGAVSNSNLRDPNPRANSSGTNSEDPNSSGTNSNDSNSSDRNSTTGSNAKFDFGPQDDSDDATSSSADSEQEIAAASNGDARDETAAPVDSSREYFSRPAREAPAIISRKILIDLRDSLRSFLTLLEGE